jgi:uncharacterized protein (DUF2164 family)
MPVRLHERPAPAHFFIKERGSSIYNQGARHAASYMQDRLADLAGEVYERED